MAGLLFSLKTGVVNSKEGRATMIKFPRMHIAQSVQNRILNIVNRVPPSTDLAPPLLPTVTDPTIQGEDIDAAVSAPAGGAALPPGGEDVMLAAALEGSSPADAAITQGVLND